MLSSSSGIPAGRGDDETAGRGGIGVLGGIGGPADGDGKRLHTYFYFLPISDSIQPTILRPPFFMLVVAIDGSLIWSP